jgi:hypothetical protein
MQDDQIATPTPSLWTRKFRAGAVAVGIAGGITAIGVTGLGSPAASASGATNPAPVTVATPTNATSDAASADVLKRLVGAKNAAAAAQPATADPNQPALDAFFKAGYDYDDAAALAKAWHESDPFTAKVDAGNRLLAGQTLPLAPGSATPAPAEAGDDAVTAFFNAGYTYDDAVTLSTMWHSASPYDAKVAAGKKLQAGQTLPIKP